MRGRQPRIGRHGQPRCVHVAWLPRRRRFAGAIGLAASLASRSGPDPFAAHRQVDGLLPRLAAISSTLHRLAGHARGRRARPLRAARRRRAAAPARTALPSAPAGSRSRSARCIGQLIDAQRARSSRTAFSPRASGATAALSPLAASALRASATVARNRDRAGCQAPRAHSAGERNRLRRLVSTPSKISRSGAPRRRRARCRAGDTRGRRRAHRPPGRRRRLAPATAAAATCPGTCACSALRRQSRCRCGQEPDRTRRRR